MPRSLPGIVARVERIRDLSDDLTRELTRAGQTTSIAAAMVAAIKRDIDAVRRALNRVKR